MARVARVVIADVGIRDRHLISYLFSGILTPPS